MTSAEAIDKVKQVAFYIVMNNDGQFFRRKGYGGYGKTWVDEPATARIYVKPGPARAVVTFFSNSYPEYPPPKILKIEVGTIEVIDEAERLAKSKERKIKAKATQELRTKQYELNRAQEELDRAKERLAKAGAALKVETKKRGK